MHGRVPTVLKYINPGFCRREGQNALPLFSPHSLGLSPLLHPGNQTGKSSPSKREPDKQEGHKGQRKSHGFGRPPPFTYLMAQMGKFFSCGNKILLQPVKIQGFTRRWSGFSLVRALHP